MLLQHTIHIISAWYVGLSVGWKAMVALERDFQNPATTASQCKIIFLTSILIWFFFQFLILLLVWIGIWWIFRENEVSKEKKYIFRENFNLLYCLNWELSDAHWGKWRSHFSKRGETHIDPTSPPNVQKLSLLNLTNSQNVFSIRSYL